MRAKAHATFARCPTSRDRRLRAAGKARLSLTLMRSWLCYFEEMNTKKMENGILEWYNVNCTDTDKLEFDGGKK